MAFEGQIEKLIEKLTELTRADKVRLERHGRREYLPCRRRKVRGDRR